MDTYYHTTYQSCPLRTSYLTSTSFLDEASYLGLLCNLFFSSYNIFLVSTKSPQAMKSAAPFMLNVAVWALACDLTWGFLTLPSVQAPVIGYICEGVLCETGVSQKFCFWLCFAVLGGTAMSQVSLFEQRQRSIVTNSKWVMSNSTRYVILFVGYAYYVNFSFPELLEWNEDQESAKLESLKLVPCPQEKFFIGPSVVVLISSQMRMFSFHMFLTTLGAYGYSIILILHTAYHLLPKNNPSMSAATRKKLQTFFAANFIQCAIPTFIIVLPLTHWNLSIFLSYYVPELNNCAVILFSMHGVSGSVASCFLYPPYRSYTKYLIVNKLLRFPEQKSSTVISVHGIDRIDRIDRPARRSLV